MFSYADKLRAVELYFKYGKKASRVVQELGYPSTRQLRRWARIIQAGGVLPESVPRKPRYTSEQKRAAVEHYLNHGCCLAFTRRSLGYPSDWLLNRWLDELHPGKRRLISVVQNHHAPFDTEVKRQAVRELCTRSESAREVAQKVGVSREVLYKWKNELKTEMYYGREWSGITLDSFMLHLDAYIRWYNERRIKLSLGAVSPVMYRQQLGIR